MKIFFFLLLSVIKIDKSTTSVPIDFIPNGWIESTANRTMFIAKCHPDYGLNSKSSYVNKSATWLPIQGFVYQNLPLCFKKCQVQSFIPNGMVRVNTRRARGATNLTGFYLDLIQGDWARYECQKGFFLQKINSDKQLKLRVKTVKCRGSDKESESGEKEQELYECVQYCQQPEFNSSLSNGFLLPGRNFYQPGDQIGYYCQDGYASRIYFYQESNLTSVVSNLHRLECVQGGIWRFLASDKTNLTKMQILRDPFLPVCLSLDVAMAKKIGHKYTINTKDLNIRSLSLVFSLVGLIIGLLCVTLSIRVFRLRRGVAYVNLPTGQPDTACIQSNLVNARPNFSLVPIHGAIMRSTPQSGIGAPPSYEQLFAQAQSSLNHETDVPSIDFSLNLNISRPGSSTASRTRANRSDVSRRSKSSQMRKKIIDKRRKTNGQNEPCSSNQC